MVHLTNGEVVAEQLRHWAGEPQLLTWDDLLHDGPVPAGLGLEQLSAERAAWLENEGFGARGEVSQDFRDRDARFRRIPSTMPVWLWFEDDLYDQLQLLQILATFAEAGHPPGKLSLIDLPRGTPTSEFGRLSAGKRQLTAAAYDLATAAWEAFRRPDPSALAALAQAPTPALPHLGPALQRLLEQFPWTTDGLNRVERVIVTLLDEKPRTTGDLFKLYGATEERPWLADSFFFRYLDELQPMIARNERGIWTLTGDPRPAVPKRWRGGCAGGWFYDPATRSLTASTSQSQS